MRKFTNYFFALMCMISIAIIPACGDDPDEPNPGTNPSNPDNTMQQMDKAPVGASVVSGFNIEGTDTDEGVQNGEELTVLVSNYVVKYQNEEYLPTSYQLVMGDTPLNTTVTKQNGVTVLKAKVNNVPLGKQKLAIKSRFEIPGYGWFYETSASIFLTVYQEKPQFDIRLSFPSFNITELEWVGPSGDVMTKYQYEINYSDYKYTLNEDTQYGVLTCPVLNKHDSGEWIYFRLNLVSNFDAEYEITSMYLNGENLGTYKDQAVKYTTEMGSSANLNVNYRVKGKCEGQDVSFVTTRQFKLKFEGK